MFAEKLCKEDLERMEMDRHAQQRAHMEQLEQMEARLTAMSASKAQDSTGKGISTKMPIFDLDKDKETFNLWKARWSRHVIGHKLDKIPNPEERQNRMMMELTAALSDFTLNWILNMNLEDEEKDNPDRILELIEENIAASTNPLIQQVELGMIKQMDYESAEHLYQRIIEKGNRCKFERVKNYQDHQCMLALLRAVQPKIRKKMLLERVDTLEKAYAILRNEEQAHKDAEKCSGKNPEAEVNATSSYRRNQRNERSESSRNDRGRSAERERAESPEKAASNSCFRCHSMSHWSNKCPHYRDTCDTCRKVGPLQKHVAVGNQKPEQIPYK